MMLVIEVAAVISGAIFGVLLARRKGMDFVGVFSVAFMTAFGGGTLRDVLLDRHPLFWIQYSWYPVIVFFVAAAVSMIPRVPDLGREVFVFPGRTRSGSLQYPWNGDRIGAGCRSFCGSALRSHDRNIRWCDRRHRMQRSSQSLPSHDTPLRNMRFSWRLGPDWL